jgi:hypothetical protein
MSISKSEFLGYFLKHNAYYPESKRYSATHACLVALIRPVRAVTRGDHLPLWKAWLVHVVGAVMVVGVSLVLTAWSDVQGTATPIQVAEVLLNMLAEMADEFQYVAMWIGLIFTVLFVEFATGLAALGAMSWCAREEKYLASYGRSLRRLLLVTPHAAMVVALVGGVIVWIERMPWDYAELFSTAELITMLSLAKGGLWLLWIMLAALGCQVAPAMCRWPARCEGCGYQLTGIDASQNCPECGLAIDKTLGAWVRPGIVGTSGFGRLLRQTYNAIRRPTAFGTRMHVISPDTGHRRNLIATIVLLMLTSPIGFGLMFMVATATRAATGAHDYTPDWNELAYLSIGVGTWIGLMMTATTVGLALGGATLLGMLEGWRHGRNMMPAAIRAACYLSGFAVAWSLVFWCNMAVFVVVMELDVLSPISARYNIASEEIVLTWHGIVLGLGLVIYLALIGRATHAARYANW